MTSTIVEASIAFAPVISALHKACFDQRWDKKAIADILTMPGASGLIVQSDKKTPQGFIIIRVATDEAEIISLGIEPFSRRNGYAGLLLEESIKQAVQKGAARMFLEVAEDNASAISFYEKTGFEITGRRTGYYQRPIEKIDALVFVREITGK